MNSPRTQLSLRTLLIIVTLVGISMMIAGLLLTGVIGGAPAWAQHRLALMPFIFTGAMAPIGVPMLIYWALRILDWMEKRKQGDTF